MKEPKEFKDRTLLCADCENEFVFTEGEQEFFYKKGLSDPKRCKPCRVLRRRSIVAMEVEEDE